MSQCEHKQHHTGGAKVKFLAAAEPAAARTRMQLHLAKLESDLAVGMNAVLKTDEQQGSSIWAGAGSRLVVEVYAEDRITRRRGRTRRVETEYLSRKPAGSCNKLYCKCGPAAGCTKQHVTTFRLKQVREPIGFRLIAPRARRGQSVQPLRYQMDDHTRQRVAASLDVV